VGAKDPDNASDAMDGAAQGPADTPVPSADAPLPAPCKKKHWFTVRVQFEDGKPVTTGIRMKVKLNTGATHNIVLNAGSGGKFEAGKTLDLSSVCEVSFPETFDAECTPK
jgi:hypothetical protein